jgi:large subunit ribosomal protein L21
MYAVIATGGKQYRVEQGDRIDVERLRGDDVSLRPVLVVDGDTVLSTAAQLQGAAVEARVVGDAKGPKINGFTYKNKSNQRKRWGHRQKYSTIEITAITSGTSGAEGNDREPGIPASSEPGPERPVAAGDKSGE